jgi:hypothetical protein
MIHKKVEFHRPQFLLNRELEAHHAGKSLKEAFADFDLLDAAHSLHRAINWSWTQWQVNPDFAPIRTELIFVVKRTLQFLAKSNDRDIENRGFHDQMMMHAAILSGDSPTIVAAAKKVRIAAPKAKGYQYEAALAGIFASRILGKQNQEKLQLEQFERYKPTRVDAFPERSLVRAFVDRDYKKLGRAVVNAAEKYWSDDHLRIRRGSPIVVNEDQDRLLLDLSHKTSRFLWPYVEATFAKLVIQDGANLKYDSFWLPLKFIM